PYTTLFRSFETYPTLQQRGILNVYSSTHSTVYSYIANSTNSIYSISNRLSSALVSDTLSITVSLLIDMGISFSVHINMKASKLSYSSHILRLRSFSHMQPV